MSTPEYARVPVTITNTFFIEVPLDPDEDGPEPSDPSERLEWLKAIAEKADADSDLYELFPDHTTQQRESIDADWSVDTDPAHWPSDEWRKVRCPVCVSRVGVARVPVDGAWQDQVEWHRRNGMQANPPCPGGGTAI